LQATCSCCSSSSWLAKKRGRCCGGPAMTTQHDMHSSARVTQVEVCGVIRLAIPSTYKLARCAFPCAGSLDFTTARHAALHCQHTPQHAPAAVFQTISTLSRASRRSRKVQQGKITRHEVGAAHRTGIGVHSSLPCLLTCGSAFALLAHAPIVPLIVLGSVALLQLTRPPSARSCTATNVQHSTARISSSKSAA
jgi:hypothetical protein